MGILDSIKSFLGGESATISAERNTSTIYIIDGDRVYEGRGNPGPGERAALLQRLAQFAQREQIKLQVVLGGRPLREAGHGDEIHGITVYYAEQGGGMVDQLAELYRKAGSAALVITSDREVEQKIEGLGGANRLMKGSTFRKALEGDSSVGGDENGGGRGERRRERGGRGGRGERGDRGDRGDRPQREPREAREAREPREPREPRPEESAGNDEAPSDNTSADVGSEDSDESNSRDNRRGAQSDQSTVKNLIDLVE